MSDIPDDSYIAVCGEPGEWRVDVHRENGAIEELNPRLDLRNHSPTGFAWGYGGSGPAQLALALCADVLGDDGRALRIYQTFARRFVSQKPMDDSWAAKRADLHHLIQELERDNPSLF